MASILLIDDKRDQLAELANEVREILRNDDVTVHSWVPSREDADVRSRFDELVTDRPTLVVTDYDLTGAGQTGLFGSTVVDWCQQRAIPVADYSRANPGSLPNRPDLFEIRVPRDANAASFISAVFRGFEHLETAFMGDRTLLKERSAAAALARVLGAPDLEADFALYSLRLGPASGALMGRLTRNAHGEMPPTEDELRAMLVFITGHLLLNAILRFAGPILSAAALRGFVAVDDSAQDDVDRLFVDARYAGPFSEIDTYYWLSRIEKILEPSIPEDVEVETSGELRRMAVERALGYRVALHRCSRCDGHNGGFYCPFTARPVCLREDCSVGSNSWIPQGARICRIERDFFDEWAPVLGL